MLLFKVVWFFISGIFRVVLLGYLVVVTSAQSTPVEMVRSYLSNMTVGDVAETINYELKGLKETIQKDEDGKLASLMTRLKERSRL